MRILTLILGCLLLTTSLVARADLGVEHTRLILEEGKPMVSTRLWNRGGAASMIQAWLDNGDASASPESIRVPYVVVPPLFRLEPGRNRDITLRAIDTASLPRDRESVFWLNIVDVPGRAAKAQASSLDYAFRWRMKVFHRPAGLSGQAAMAASKLQWSVRRDESGARRLHARNPTPYFVSLDAIKAAGATFSLSGENNLVGPLNEWSAPGEMGYADEDGGSQIHFTWIDDSGERHSLTTQASG